MTEAPAFMTPEEFASHFGWSPRHVREFARKIGACRIIGRKMVLLQTDIDAILEASKPEPARSPAGRAKFQSPKDDYQQLLLLRARLALEKSKASKRKPRS
ncbi:MULTISPECIES: hypothetical protein [unclassified Rhizobium]|uniref:hypothetical protein n=1 Tax=unclassified Rhizobium TaxID=2613769 RepID=UPI0012E187D5|nr:MULTISPECIES: hypothetical protein [unclassified Rhizobium]